METYRNRPSTFVKQCVVCSRELVPFRQWGVELDCCPNCGGIWLDRGEIDSLLEEARREEALRRAQTEHGAPAVRGGAPAAPRRVPVPA